MKKILKYQIVHIAVYIGLGVLLLFAADRLSEQGNTFLGFNAFDLSFISWIFAGIHQFWIVFFWRAELHFKMVSRAMGPFGFLLYKIGFVVFSLIRLLLLIPVSAVSAESFSVPFYSNIIIVVVMTPFIVWGLFSVVFYFGINRAFGADHFDPAFRTTGLEKRGIFKYIPNSMYTVIMLMVYYPGLLWLSPLGLIAAAVHHLFVWTHYFCTEKPDMKEIYGESG